MFTVSGNSAFERAKDAKVTGSQEAPTKIRGAIHLNYLGVHLNCIKNLFYLDVCLNMCSSAIRYAWFCTSVSTFFCNTYIC